MKLHVNGASAYAYTGGKPFDPALPCIAFVHGASNDHSVFTLLARWFAHHGHSVLAVDLPGHLRSEGPLLGSVEALAAKERHGRGRPLGSRSHVRAASAGQGHCRNAADPSGLCHNLPPSRPTVRPSGDPARGWGC